MATEASGLTSPQLAALIGLEKAERRGKGPTPAFALGVPPHVVRHCGRLGWAGCTSGDPHSDSSMWILLKAGAAALKAKRSEA